MYKELSWGFLVLNGQIKNSADMQNVVYKNFHKFKK